MGWKTLKTHYRIKHNVHVRSEGFCIGSPYISDIIVINRGGKIIKGNEDHANHDLNRYLAEMKADPAALLKVIQADDVFEKSITVYTFSGAKIIEKQCEKLGWPNVTHDGEMMYENSFSPNKSKVVKWAKENARCGIEWRTMRVAEIKEELATMEMSLAEVENNLKTLESEFPNPPSSVPSVASDS